MDTLNIIEPTWPAPPNIVALTTRRSGGKSMGPYSSLNLAAHVNDDLEHVLQNRYILGQELCLPTAPFWLNQTHSSTVQTIEPGQINTVPNADGSYTQVAEQICVILSADCLPVLICNKKGDEVAAIHSGWRGCLAGILTNAVACFKSPPSELLAWMGPAIGPQVYEVGPEVFDAFVAKNSVMTTAFQPQPNQKYLANLYQLARLALADAGVKAVYGGEYCSFSDPKSFFSYRRDGGITGRMATLIYFKP